MSYRRKERPDADGGLLFGGYFKAFFAVSFFRDRFGGGDVMRFVGDSHLLPLDIGTFFAGPIVRRERWEEGIAGPKDNAFCMLKLDTWN